MSLPSFPDKDNIPTREEVINQIIASIAMEELGLSHIINAEGEKLQYALGTIPGVPGPDGPLTMEELLKLNESIHKTLDSTMMNQFFLKEKLLSALSASVMLGPTGPAGPAGPMGPVGPEGSEGPAGAGIQILASFKTLADLIAAHATGRPGEVYAVGGVLHYWNAEAAPPAWTPIDNLHGPTGPEGQAGAGIEISGSFKTLNDLIAAHATGSPGEVYAVDGVLHYWNADAAPPAWTPIDNLHGPTGPEGQAGAGIEISGSFKTLADLIAAHATGSPGEVYAVDGVLHYWNADAAPPAWTPIDNLHGPTGPAGAGIGLIPFATGGDAVPALHTDSQGQPTNIMLTSFGGHSQRISKTSTGFTFPPSDGFFYAFTLSHDIKIKSIYATITNWADFSPPAGSSVYPYIILATAARDSNNFRFLGRTKTVVSTPWSGGSNIPQNTNLFAALENVDETIPAGSRLAICCTYEMSNGSNTFFGYYFYYSGSIYYE